MPQDSVANAADRVYAANTPHNPVRFADTIGPVMERVRPEGSIGRHPTFLISRNESDAWISPDRLRWYCKQGGHAKPTIIREESLHATDLGTQLKPIIQNWQDNPELRKCGECGAVAEAKYLLFTLDTMILQE